MVRAGDLLRSQAFKDCPEAVTEKLSGFMDVKTFAANEHILDPSNPSDAFYFIIEGRVEIYRAIRGVMQILCVLDVGDIFGEVSFMDMQPPSASAVAVDEKVKLAVLTQESFVKLKKEDPDACCEMVMCLMRELGRKFRALNEGLDVKSSEWALHELILHKQEVKITTNANIDYVCRIDYCDTAQISPMMKIDVQGQMVLIPFHQIQSIKLPNRYGRY